MYNQVLEVVEVRKRKFWLIFNEVRFEIVCQLIVLWNGKHILLFNSDSLQMVWKEILSYDKWNKIKNYIQ